MARYLSYLPCNNSWILLFCRTKICLSLVLSLSFTSFLLGVYIHLQRGGHREAVDTVSKSLCGSGMLAGKGRKVTSTYMYICYAAFIRALGSFLLF